MCSRCAIFGANRCRCATYLASYKSFMVRSPPGLAFLKRQFSVVLSTANLQTFHSPVGLRHTLPIPLSYMSVAPIHVGLLARISLKWFGRSVRDATRFLHRLSSSWIAAVMLMRRPAATLSACFNLVNFPWDPAMAGTALCRKPRRHCQF